MSIANVTEGRILALIFQAVAWARYADNAASSAETSIAVALHTSDPTDAGNMSTAEPLYVGYARVNVARSAAGWALSGSVVSPDAPAVISPVANINLPSVGVSSPVESVPHFSLGATGGGAQDILFTGTISPPIMSSPAGLVPRLTQGSTISLD